MKRKKVMTWLLISAMAATAMLPGTTAAYAEDTTQVVSEEAAGNSVEGVFENGDPEGEIKGEDSDSEIVSEDTSAAGTVDNSADNTDETSDLIEDPDGGAAQDIPVGDAPDLFYEESVEEANADLAGANQDTGLKISAFDGSQGDYQVDAGEDITFHAYATVDPSVQDKTIKYTWKDTQYNVIGSGETYTVHDVQKQQYLICQADDAYGNYVYMYFSVSVAYGWTADIYRGDEFVAACRSQVGMMTVPYNGSLTLTAVVTNASPESELSYYWKPAAGYDQIQGESHEAELTLNNIIQSQEWECDVTDQYDNIERVYCLIKPDTGMKLSTDCGTYNNGYYEIETSADSYTLRVKVSAEGEFAEKPFSYKWTSSQVNEYIKDEGEGTIASANEEITLRIDDLKHGYATFTCEVTDATGNNAFVNFRFMPDEEFAVADRAIVQILDGSTGSYVNLDAASDAGVGDTSLYGYQWEYNDEFGSRVVPVNSEEYKGSVFRYKIPYDHDLDVYRCTITDRFSRSAELTYYLIRAGYLQNLSYEDGNASGEISLGGSRYWSLCKINVDEAGRYRFYTGYDGNRFVLFDQEGEDVSFDNTWDGGAYAQLSPDRTYYLAIWNSEGAEYQTGIEKASDEPDDPEEPDHIHDMEWFVDTEPTCEEEGYEYQECIDCGEYGEERSIPALGHDWDDGKVTVNATCATNGVRTYTCMRCGETKTEAIPATGVHSFGAWTTTRRSTVLQEGVESRVCTVCGKTETRPIDRLAASGYLNVKTVPLKKKQKSHAVTILGMAEGDYVKSCVSSSTKVVEASPYGAASVSLKAGKKTGKATVRVTLASGKQLKLTVKVQSGKVRAKKISLACGRKLTLKKGQTVRIGASVTPITTTDKVKYTSSNKKVAKVSKGGVITARKRGKTVITVKAGNKTVKIKVIVK